MKIIITEDYDELSIKGAEIIAEVIKNNPRAVLGLATGSTPIGAYKNLVKTYGLGNITFKEIETVNLDEYAGLGEESEHSYVSFMRENLFDKVDIDLKNTHLPNGKAENLNEECERYSRLVFSHTQDIQLLGLGSNGHIGFNEPFTPFNSLTHVVNLTENTIKDNSRLFEKEEDVPRQAITMGIREIMQAKKILVLASGKNKAKAVYSMVKGEVSEECPASVLQRHSDVMLVIDREAASLL
ncbi:MAG: glucosamine-6-phosphate deaminase [Clostridia bacterium]|nr:glucosamine-6-phosphate deaminase [Clostridia bacterium]